MLSVTLLHNYLLLRISGELLPHVDIVERQFVDHSVVYGTALFHTDTSYKLYAYEKHAPKVVAVGSSRVMEFRDAFFQDAFYTMGGIANSIPRAKYVVEQMLMVHKPEVIILGLDFWWFGDNAITNYKHVAEQSTQLKLQHLVEPYNWLFSHKISLIDYFTYLNGSEYKKSIGIMGKVRNEGFGYDGSYYYTSKVNGQNIVTIGHKRFMKTLENITRSKGHFYYSRDVNKVSIQKLLELVDYIRSNNVDVVAFLPPVAPTVASSLLGDSHAYIKKIKKVLLSYGITLIDTHDPQFLGSTDCEFIDGVHGGDVTYARVLKYIAQSNINLSKYIDFRYLDYITDKYSGLAMIPNKDITAKPEVDFLGLGCKKQTHI